ncbi:Hsp33 family molecular chaperone HslO [Thermotoga sp.]|uniref:Hsp33 family molecular chaperone HslO n=1 Tax=Thermotoga sp. TaxID=28240 RepID=UPI0025D7BAF7|nr:Hsp33 family molecular chaperone HslO [Thermotoga sp.]MCD6552301.1 Hsp33 family molecular chaperone HslO [Thermotoga sp.]
MIYYGTIFDHKVRFSIVRMKEVVEEVRNRHNLSYLATVVLGRALIGAALMTPWLAEGERWTLDIEGDGPIRKVIAQSTNKFTVRGYVANPSVELPLKENRKFNVSGAIGRGALRVIRDLGLKTPFVSQVPLVSGEIAEDLAYYFTVSEQIPSAFSLGVLMDTRGVKIAGGFAVQILDRSLEKENVEMIENNIKNLPYVTKLFQETEPLDVLEMIFGEKVGFVETAEIRYRCDCNREKAKSALLVLDEKELEDMRKEGKGEVICKWCSTKYVFSEEELRELLKLKKNSASS